MKTLTRSDFQIIADRKGYMVYYLGHGVAGAGTLSGGAHIRGKAVMKQIGSYCAMGEIDIAGIIQEGESGSHYKRLCEINEIFNKKHYETDIEK